jgi:hypothetical protein
MFLPDDGRRSSFRNGVFTQNERIANVRFSLKRLGFQVVIIHIVAFRVMTPYSLVVRYQCFRTTLLPRSRSPTRLLGVMVQKTTIQTIPKPENKF